MKKDKLPSPTPIQETSKNRKISAQDKIDADNHAAIMWWNSISNFKATELLEQFYPGQWADTEKVLRIWKEVAECNLLPTQPEQPTIKAGMKVYHKTIRQFLLIVADENGPAYTGNEFADDEISLSHALTEFNNGNISFEQPTTEGEYTKGKLEWSDRSEVSDIPSGESTIPFSIYKVVGRSAIQPIADICNFPPATEAQVNEMRANAARIVECWNGYDKAKNDAEENYGKFQDLGNLYIILKGKNESLKQANRELIEALEGLYDSIDRQILNHRFGDELGKASEAINKHTK